MCLITVAARPKAWTFFTCSNTGIMGSNSTRVMNVCVRLFCVCVVLCVGSGLSTGWSPVQGVLRTVYKLRNWKDGQGPQRVVEPYIDKRMCPFETKNWRIDLLWYLCLKGAIALLYLRRVRNAKWGCCRLIGWWWRRRNSDLYYRKLRHSDDYPVDIVLQYSFCCMKLYESTFKGVVWVSAKLIKFWFCFIFSYFTDILFIFGSKSPSNLDHIFFTTFLEWELVYAAITKGTRNYGFTFYAIFI
jgi:hypothetical protein